MKKTILAVMVVASAVLSAQALATNKAEVTIQGEVTDSKTSCVVTPTGTLNNGIVTLMTVTTNEVDTAAINTLLKEQKFGFKVERCAEGGSDIPTGLKMSVTGTIDTNNTTLKNTAPAGADNVGIGITDARNGSRLDFTGATPITTSYTVGQATNVDFNVGYVRISSSTPVQPGPVKGVATFTIDYTV